MNIKNFLIENRLTHFFTFYLLILLFFVEIFLIVFPVSDHLLFSVILLLSLFPLFNKKCSFIYFLASIPIIFGLLFDYFNLTFIELFDDARNGFFIGFVIAILLFWLSNRGLELKLKFLKFHVVMFLSMLIASFTYFTAANNLSRNDVIRFLAFNDIYLSEKYVFLVSLHDGYVWSNKSGSLWKHMFMDKDSLINEVTELTDDKWTYRYLDKKSKNFSEESKVGVGLVLAKVEGKYLIDYIWENSPSSKTSLKRGEELVSINNIPIDEFYSDPDEYVSDTYTIRVIRDNKTHDISVNPDYYYKDATITHWTLHENSISSVLYVNILSFDIFTDGEFYDGLNESTFVEPTHLVIDLRSNSGGVVRSAANIVEMIIGDKVDGKRLYSLDYNEKYADKNITHKSELFTDPALTELKEVIFLVSSDTCSASEFMINTMYPFIDVTVIGEKTCGKSVGYVPIPMQDDSYLGVMEFVLKNSKGTPSDRNGITPDIKISDHIEGSLGEIGEPLFDQALKHILSSSIARS